MKLLIDADGCPVVDLAVRMAVSNKVECIIVCDTSHVFEKTGAKTVTVSKGADSADFALVNMVQKGDVVVTQDYGLAAMCLARNAIPVSQDGMVYNNSNIDALLMQRYHAKKIRMGGGRLKGQPKRTREQDVRFENGLQNLMEMKS
ncbi:MAG: YaiI/YqxD family protein [Saccharofermentanales bacterium]